MPVSPFSPHFRNTALWTIAFAAVCFALGTARADKIYLKSGEVLSGQITAESDDIVRIVISSGTIKDTKTVNKVSIERIERTTPEDFAYEEAMKVIPTAAGLTANEYDQLIKRPRDFLAKYPESSRRASIQKVIDQLNDEKKKVELGFRKFRTEWLSPQEQLTHRVNMEADDVLAQMRSVVAGTERGWHLMALRMFERLEKDFQGTLAFPEAVEVAKQVLPKYGGHLQNEIQYARYEVAKRQKALASLTDHKRVEYQRVLAQEKQRMARQQKLEKDRGIKWTTVDMVDESSLKSGIDRVRKEIARLAKLDLEPYRQQADLIYETETLLAADQLDEAKAKLEEAMDVRNAVKNSKKTPVKILAAIDTKVAQLDEKMQKAKALADRGDSDVVKLAQAMKAGDTAAADQSGETEGTDGEQPLSTGDALQEMARKRAEQKKAAEAKTAAAKKGPTKTTKKPAKKPRTTSSTAARRSSGGFNFLYVLPVILVAATGIIYTLDKKKKAQDGGGGGE